MDKLTAVLAILGILIQVLILALLIRRKPARERGAMQEMLRRMQKEEQKLRREQSAQTNETIQLSMQMVSDNLSQNQSQTRDTTAAQLRQFEERIQGLESANARAMSELRETVSQQMEQLRTQSCSIRRKWTNIRQKSLTSKRCMIKLLCTTNTFTSIRPNL